jgi:hypothetical protein
LENAIQGNRGQYRQEKEQAAELRVERARAQVELPDIGDFGGGRPRIWWTLVIGPAWQASESFILDDLGDGDRTEAVALVGQITANIVDREVLFAEGDDELVQGIGLRRGLGSLGRCEKEWTVGILTERDWSELVKYNLQSVRSYLLCEDFQRFWTYQYHGWASWFLREWPTRTMRSNIKVKLTTRKAYGFRTFNAVKTALYHSLGNYLSQNSPTDSAEEAEFLGDGRTSARNTNLFKRAVCPIRMKRHSQFW